MAKFNKITGHMATCYYRFSEKSVISEKKPFCIEDLEMGMQGEQTCPEKVTVLSCLQDWNHGIAGLCEYHWKKYCESMGWDEDLSCCANERCGRLGFNLKQRKCINQYNFAEKLEFCKESANKEYNHISDKRREEAYDKQLPLKKRKISYDFMQTTTKVQKTCSEIFTKCNKEDLPYTIETKEVTNQEIKSTSMILVLDTFLNTENNS